MGEGSVPGRTHRVLLRYRGTVFFKNGNVIKDKGRLWTCFRLKESKESDNRSAIHVIVDMILYWREKWIQMVEKHCINVKFTG